MALKASQEQHVSAARAHWGFGVYVDLGAADGLWHHSVSGVWVLITYRGTIWPEGVVPQGMESFLGKQRGALSDAAISLCIVGFSKTVPEAR